MAELAAVVSLRVRAGDDLVLEFAVTRDGDEVDLTAMTPRFAVRRKPGATAVVTTEGGTPTATAAITNAAGGVYRVTVDKTVTAGLSGTYRFESELQDGSGDVATVARGFLTFEPKLI